jgi:hypothetical protein
MTDKPTHDHISRTVNTAPRNHLSKRQERPKENILARKSTLFGGRGVLGDGLSALRDSVLGKLTRQDQTDSGIWVSKCDEGSRWRKTYDVWISRDEMVDFLLYAASFEASVATRSKISLTKELRMLMARLEIPVSGWTCLRTAKTR